MPKKKSPPSPEQLRFDLNVLHIVTKTTDGWSSENCQLKAPTCAFIAGKLSVKDNTVNTTMVSSALKRLVANNEITCAGHGRWTRYFV